VRRFSRFFNGDFFKFNLYFLNRMDNFASAKRKSGQVFAISKYCNAEAISAMLYSHIWIACRTAGEPFARALPTKNSTTRNDTHTHP
jgi:hypothetical protein